MLASLIINLAWTRVGVALKKLLPYLFVVLAIVLILCWIYNSGYDHGVEVTDHEYQTAIQEERNRQIVANQEALDQAEKRQLELERLLDERNAKIDELLLEGSNDPDANRRSINSGSVFRLNRIR
tara:strand:+ start:26689 stop:27063 length:375 start_codon:yes stop_codon:yes gene_type:complete